MRVSVTKPYQRPYKNPLDVLAGDRVLPDFEKFTDFEGWVWCMAEDGRSGWAPQSWLGSLRSYSDGYRSDLTACMLEKVGSHNG